jgi:hypothetical protein
MNPDTGELEQWHPAWGCSWGRMATPEPTSGRRPPAPGR